MRQRRVGGTGTAWRHRLALDGDSPLFQGACTMAHSTLALLGVCCLAAALLGAQASAARTPAALQGASEPADRSAHMHGLGPFWLCYGYGSKALVTALNVRRTWEGGLAASVKFFPGEANCIGSTTLLPSHTPANGLHLLVVSQMCGSKAALC